VTEPKTDPKRHLPKGALKATMSKIEKWEHPTQGGRIMPGYDPPEEKKVKRPSYRK
jgi:hypothetical protein